MKNKVNHQQHVTAFTPNLSPLKVNNIKARTTKNLLIQKMKVVSGGGCSGNSNTQQQQGNERNKISINNINVNTKHFNVNANAFDFAVFAQAKLKHTATSKDVCDVSNTHIHNVNAGVNANANVSTSNSLTKKIISNLRNQFNEITKHKCTSVSTSVNMQSPMNSNYNTPNANAYIVNNTQHQHQQQQQQQTHINNKHNKLNNNNYGTQQQDSMYLHLTTQHSTNNSKSKSKNKHHHHHHQHQHRNIKHKTNNVKSDNMSYTNNPNNNNNIKLKSQHIKKETYTCINSRNNSKCKDTTNNYYEIEHLTLESLNLDDMKRQYIVTDLAQERLTYTITPSKPASHTNNNNKYLSHVIEVLKNIILIQQRSYNEMITKYKQQCEHVFKQLQHKVDFLLNENNALKRYIMNIFACVAVYEDTMQSEDNKRNQLLSKMLIENVYLRQMNQFVGGKWSNSGGGSDGIKQRTMMGVRDSCLYKKGNHGSDNLNLTYIHVDGDNNKEWRGKDKYSQVLGRNGKCNNKSYSYEHKSGSGSGSGSGSSNASSNNGKLIKCPKTKISYNQYKNN